MDVFHVQFNVVGQDILCCAQERPRNTAPFWSV